MCLLDFESPRSESSLPTTLACFHFLLRVRQHIVIPSNKHIRTHKTHTHRVIYHCSSLIWRAARGPVPVKLSAWVCLSTAPLRPRQIRRCFSNTPRLHLLSPRTIMKRPLAANAMSQEIYYYAAALLLCAQCLQLVKPLSTAMKGNLCPVDAKHEQVSMKT